MTPLLIIGGPTGSGKSDLAVAVAQRINGEIVSADSMQIYRGLDIGTAKITSVEMRGIPHHMIDIVDPTETFTAAEYKQRATEIIRDVASRGRVPIICGGTGLYINSVLYDMSFSGEFDPVLRAELQSELSLKGREAMHEKLADLDPDAARRLHPNDEKRVLRAIEKALTGAHEEDDVGKPKYPYRMYVTDLDRASLYDRIDRRVDKMISMGLKCEVEALLARGIGYDRQCMQAIAYKEWAKREEGMSDSEIVELIKKNTRNYAKRQITWFKQYRDAVKVDLSTATIEEWADRIEKDYVKL